jgi:hypothetical protein
MPLPSHDLETLAAAAVARGLPPDTDPPMARAMEAAIVDTLRPTWQLAPSADGARRAPYWLMVRNAVWNAGLNSNVRKPRWWHVSEALAVGSTCARELCRHFGKEPEELVGSYGR